MSAAGSALSAVRSSTKVIYGLVDADKLAKPYDVVIVGGGPAGVAGRAKAAFLGRRALLVDNATCAPTELDLTFGAPTGLFSKALRDTAKTMDVGLLSRMGLNEGVIWMQVGESIKKLATNNVKTQMDMLKEFKVDYLRAKATLEAGLVVSCEANGTVYKVPTSNVMLTTGSTPTRPDNIPFDDERIFDSSIAKLTFLPRKGVVIAGAGIIAIEYAKIFAKLQCPVTMVIRGDAKSSLSRIGLDPSIADGLLDDLEANGVTVLTNTSTKSFDIDDDEKTLTLTIETKDAPEPPPPIVCDVFLAAMGRRPCSGNVGLAEVNGVIDAKSGVIKVDDSFKVEGAPEGVFAAGDVIGPPALASTGVEQAKSAISCMFGEDTSDKVRAAGRQAVAHSSLSHLLSLTHPPLSLAGPC